MTPTLRRRHVLLALLIGAGPLMLAFRSRIRRGTESIPSYFDEATVGRLRRTLHSPARLEHVGRAYLARYRRSDIESRTLAPSHSSLRLPHAPTTADSVSQARQALRHQVERDFADKRIAIVAGWFLSETEAEVCATTVPTARHG